MTKEQAQNFKNTDVNFFGIKRNLLDRLGKKMLTIWIDTWNKEKVKPERRYFSIYNYQKISMKNI